MNVAYQRGQATSALARPHWLVRERPHQVARVWLIAEPPFVVAGREYERHAIVYSGDQPRSVWRSRSSMPAMLAR
jgi:hypothetical protein